jgi:hypothetical protein
VCPSSYGLLLKAGKPMKMQMDRFFVPTSRKHIRKQKLVIKLQKYKKASQRLRAPRRSKGSA